MSTEVGQGTLFNIVWTELVEDSGCKVSFGDVRFSNLDFARDAVTFAETLELLVGALEPLSSELEPLGLKVSFVKTKIRVFNDSLGVALQSVPVFVESVEWVIMFTWPISAVISTSLRDIMKLID